MTDFTPAPDHFPAEAANFHLPGPAGALEMATDIPEPGQARQGTAIICHPHPEHGGTMRNKVVTMVERALRESGLATVRFNFRGIGSSEGSFDDGNGESDDLVAVADWVRRVQPHDALWLAGFSFGSYIALRNAERLGTAALITVAPPIDRGYDMESFALPDCPWLLVQGEADEVVDPVKVFAWAEELAVSPNVIRMPETSHFFHRRLLDLRGAIKNAVKPWLPAERKD